MSMKVEMVKDTQGQAVFMQLERMVYANDPLHIPAKEPFPTEGRSFIAYRNQQPVARCCARMQTGNNTIGTIGNFQALNEPAATKAILQTAVEWLKKQGVHRVVGPMDGDTWHHYRFNIGPFDLPPFIKEPWNPHYYPVLWENAGFSVIETYVSYIVDNPDLAAANQEKFYNRCIKNGYTFNPITSKNYEQILPLIHEMSCRIFSKNKLYTPVGLQEFNRMYQPAKPLMESGLSWLVVSPEKTPVGYIFTFPDYADALRTMNGKTSLFAKTRFLLNKRKAIRTCIKTLGVVPEKQGLGLTAALTYLSYKNSVELGFHQTLMCLMHSSNDSRRFGGKADKPFRSYALYEYSND